MIKIQIEEKMNKAVIFFMAMAVTFSPVLLSIAKAGMLDNYNFKVKIQGIDVYETFRPKSLSDHTQRLTTNGQKHAIGLGVVAIAATVILVANDDDDDPIQPGRTPGMDD